MFIKNTAIHFLFSSLLPLVDVAGFLLASQIAFIEVLLTLLLPIMFTLGSLTEPGAAGTFPLLFITAVLLVGTAAFIAWFEVGGTFVLLFLIFLLSLFFSSFWSSFAFYSFAFSASLSATPLANFLITWFLLLRQPKKLIFLTPLFTLLLFL